VEVRPLASACVGVAVHPGDDVSAIVAGEPSKTTFCIAPGRYSITATIVPKTGDRLIGQPGAILDAGIPITGWHRTGAVWGAAAPRTTPTFDYGGGYGGSYEYPQAVFADDVFEGNRPLLKSGVEYGGRTIGNGLATLRAGEYFYDYDDGTVYTGSDPVGRRVELVGLPDGVIHSYEPDVMVRGLIVQGSLGDGIVTGSGSGWTVEWNNVRLNHSEGVRTTDGGQILDNYIHDNGTYGIAASGNSMRVVGNEVARNNTSRYRFADGECSDAGGSKITLSSNVLLENNWYYRNHCIGIWFDINNTNVTILRNRVDQNYENGIDYEISYNGVIRHNEVSGSPHWAIVDSASPYVTIRGNSVTSTGDGSIIINQGPRTDWPSANGPHYADHIRVYGNRVRMYSGVTGAQEYSVAGTPFEGVAFSPTNSFYDNHYIFPSLRRDWFDWATGPVSISTWRGIGQDTTSRFVRK
jgi:parallel beta-helix repeat protein